MSRRKRQSGNGTANKQWLYIFWNIPFIWVCKIGISGNVKTRHRQVDRTSRGIDIPVWYIRIYFAYQLEQWLHRVFSFARVRFTGSGHTERFFIIAAVPALILSLLFFIIEWAFWLASGVFLLWLLAGQPPLTNL